MADEWIFTAVYFRPLDARRSSHIYVIPDIPQGSVRDVNQLRAVDYNINRAVSYIGDLFLRGEDVPQPEFNEDCLDPSKGGFGQRSSKVYCL
jgi:hypothetical protein